MILRTVANLLKKHFYIISIFILSCNNDIYDKIALYQYKQFNTNNNITKEIISIFHQLNSNFIELVDTDSFWIINNKSGSFKNNISYTALYLSDKDTLAYSKRDTSQIKEITGNKIEIFNDLIDYVKLKKELPLLHDGTIYTFIIKVKKVKNNFEITGENFINFKKVDKFN